MPIKKAGSPRPYVVFAVRLTPVAMPVLAVSSIVAVVALLLVPMLLVEAVLALRQLAVMAA